MTEAVALLAFVIGCAIIISIAWNKQSIYVWTLLTLWLYCGECVLNTRSESLANICAYLAICYIMSLLTCVMLKMYEEKRTELQCVFQDLLRCINGKSVIYKIMFVIVVISFILILGLTAVIVFVKHPVCMVTSNALHEYDHEIESKELVQFTPLDIRDEIRRVLDTSIPYAERNAALITIRYTLNANEIAALEKCILEEPCCVGTEIHALKNDIMNLLRKRGGALNEVIGFFCASADVFLAKGDDVMVDYCIQHTAAALEGDVEPNVHAEAMEMLQNATEYPEKSWSATALISLDRLLGASPEERKFLESRTIELLKASPLDAVRVSCIGVARKNHWTSAIPILKALQKRRDLSMSMRLAIDSALKDM